MSAMKKIFGQNASGENGLEAFGHNFKAHLINGRCCYRHAGELMEEERYTLNSITSYKSLAAWGMIWSAIGGTIGLAFDHPAVGASIIPGFWALNSLQHSLRKTHRETLNNNSSPRNPGL